MIDKSRNIASLIKKRNQDLLTEDEHLELQNWLSESEKNRQLFENLTNPEYVQNGVRNYASSLKEWDRFESPSHYSVKPFRKRLYQYAAAVALFAFLSIVAYLIFPSSNKKDSITNPTSTVVNDVPPGGHKAILILPGNQMVSLSDVPKGLIAKQGGSAITKTDDGNIKYEGSGGEGTHVLQTPRGGFYHLTFSDGSKVWLNAETTLRYPATFTGKQRRVEVNGEAYFEISKNKEMPFIVKSGNIEVEVLGTRFNFQSYNDEQQIATTLIEGSVKISVENESLTSIANKIIVPGQQAFVTRNQQSIQTINVDAENVISWVYGSFYFREASLMDVMRQLSRWYDVRIVLSSDFSTTRTFKGSIQRDIPLSRVLMQLSKFGNFSYQIENRMVTIGKP